jgi:hypothetical protein
VTRWTLKDWEIVWVPSWNLATSFIVCGGNQKSEPGDPYHALYPPVSCYRGATNSTDDSLALREGFCGKVTTRPVAAPGEALS